MCSVAANTFRLQNTCANLSGRGGGVAESTGLKTVWGRRVLGKRYLWGQGQWVEAGAQLSARGVALLLRARKLERVEREERSFKVPYQT